MSRLTKQIYKSLEELVQACERYKECQKCEECPMSVWCIEENNLADIAYNVPSSLIDDFITGADELTAFISKEDDEANEWDVRRNDPDYQEYAFGLMND